MLTIGRGTAGVCYAGVLEYLAQEVLIAAGGAADAEKKKTIAPKHFAKGIRTDDELSKLLASCMIVKK